MGAESKTKFISFPVPASRPLMERTVTNGTARKGVKRDEELHCATNVSFENFSHNSL
jgi:hypothetical protein